jgi:hypothetical protein
MMGIIDYKWFTGRDSIGVVLIYDEYDGYKAYIGLCQTGNSEMEDVMYIPQYGSKFPIEAAKKLFTHINFEE